MLVAGLASGCSSQIARFNSAADIFTGSTAKPQMVAGGEKQPFPGDVQARAAPALDSVSTGSVDRATLAPVQAQPLPPPVATAAALPAAAPAAAGILDPAGWSRTGGSQVSTRAGDTLNGLSQRYGVPVNILAQVNGLSADAPLQAGQKLLVPAYVHAQTGGAVAAGAAQLAAASQALPAAAPVPANVPLPTRAPEQAVAILPQKPKVKEPQAALADAAASAGTAKAVESAVALAKPEAVKAVAAAAGAYTVQSGDTLSRISKQTGVSVAALKAANGMQDGVLQIGQVVKIPAGGAAVAAVAPSLDTAATASIPKAKTLAAGAAVAALAPAPAAPASKVIEQAEAAPDVAPAATGIGKMRWPVNGRVISGYGKGGGKANDGIDIAVPEGTPVKAAENGVVIYAGDGLKEFGNTVLVRHDDGLVTVYGNASELKVQRGQKVKRGDQIAVSGMSGSATAPKLHFEVRKNSAPVDPGKYLE